jgi:hypothetical protein
MYSDTHHFFILCIFSTILTELGIFGTAQVCPEGVKIDHHTFQNKLNNFLIDSFPRTMVVFALLPGQN